MFLLLHSSPKVRFKYFLSPLLYQAQADLSLLRAYVASP